MVAGEIVGIIIVGLAPIVIFNLGFHPAGIVAGSYAARMQASIGNVVGGGLFAAAQSVASTGFKVSTQVYIILATSAAGGVFYNIILSNMS